MELLDQAGLDDSARARKRKGKPSPRSDKHPRTTPDDAAACQALTAACGAEDSGQSMDTASPSGGDRQAQPLHNRREQEAQQAEDGGGTTLQSSMAEGANGESGSGMDADQVASADKYIRGTRLVIGGWFQACRGCNEPTAHTTSIDSREVPLCPRCRGKFDKMVSGQYPDQPGPMDAAVEPLCYWLPRLLTPMPPLAPEARRSFCSMLVLRQDDAWNQLCKA